MGASLSDRVRYAGASGTCDPDPSSSRMVDVDENRQLATRGNDAILDDPDCLVHCHRLRSVSLDCTNRLSERFAILTMRSVYYVGRYLPRKLSFGKCLVSSTSSSGSVSPWLRGTLPCILNSGSSPAALYHLSRFRSGSFRQNVLAGLRLVSRWHPVQGYPITFIVTSLNPLAQPRSHAVTTSNLSIAQDETINSRSRSPSHTR